MKLTTRHRSRGLRRGLPSSGVSPFGEVDYPDPPIEGLGGGGNLIKEYGWVPSTPIEPGHSVVTGFYEMSGDPKLKNPLDKAGGFGGDFYGGGPAIDRLVEGNPKPEDCDPYAWTLNPSLPETDEFFSEVPDDAKFVSAEHYRGLICEILTTWLDPNTTCLPPSLRRRLAEEWKKTRVIVQKAPCLVKVRDRVGEAGGYHWVPNSNRDIHFLVLCETSINEYGGGALRYLYEVLLHEMLHSVKCSEFEAYAIVSYCLGPKNTKQVHKGNASPDNGIPWNLVKNQWDQDTGNDWIVYHEETELWEGQWIWWDCATGQIWLKSEDGGRGELIFPNADADTSNAEPPLWQWGLLNTCPP